MRRRRVLLLALVALGACSDDVPQTDSPRLPWMIEIDSDGDSRVFGISLGKSSFGEAEAVLGKRYTLAMFGPRDGVPQLEAYFAEVALDGLTGRMVLNLALPVQDLEAMRDRSPADRVQVEGHERRWKVADEDLALVRKSVVAVMAYVPAVNLEPEVLESRFGTPPERLSGPDGSQHWMYPDRGLDIVVNPEGRELLQYVNPADFERLRAPLLHRVSG